MMPLRTIFLARLSCLPPIFGLQRPNCVGLQASQYRYRTGRRASETLDSAAHVRSIWNASRPLLRTLVPIHASGNCARPSSLDPTLSDERVFWDFSRWPGSTFGAATSISRVLSWGCYVHYVLRILNHQLSSRSLSIMPLQVSAIPIYVFSLHTFHSQ
ncbi:uncharacterized protein BT62DRAFT_1078690 [Guyanagaster necrorhizus]|uniref:Secreted protein n=1 Tax=Guyanagaster necrorhizus TaxID=856835 RepID=A0A9P8APT2_9AGAR|nr:uncharacterized protein BT62DRAFT_1078690 [Guyanagaster necrorhizus MCA 3950]KAG7443329.1 hypothetical protein BT62DRAFT_1078690 [Guyanagaster necrorhizus MCA 3950]